MGNNIGMKSIVFLGAFALLIILALGDVPQESSQDVAEASEFGLLDREAREAGRKKRKGNKRNKKGKRNGKKLRGRKRKNKGKGKGKAMATENKDEEEKEMVRERVQIRSQGTTKDKILQFLQLMCPQSSQNTEREPTD